MGPHGLMTSHLVGSQAPEPVHSHMSLVKKKTAGTGFWQCKVDKSLIAGFQMRNQDKQGAFLPLQETASMRTVGCQCRMGMIKS